MAQLRRPALAICALVLAVSAAGCNSATPETLTPSPLSDPSAILGGSFVALESTTTVHVDGTLGGTINASSLGAIVGMTAALTGTVKLDGTKVAGDIDMSRQAFDLTLAFPASLLGLKAEAILVDGYSYTMFDLFSSKYTRTQVSSSVPSSGGAPASSASPGATLDFADIVRQIKSRLDSSGTTTTLVGLDAVDGRDTYHLRLAVPAGALNQEIGAAAGTAASGVTLDVTTLDYWVYTDGLAPARLQTTASSPTLGDIDLSLTLTQYDKPVTIQAPPDSQIEAG